MAAAVGVTGGARVQRGGLADQPGGGQALQLLAELGRGGDQQPLEGVDDLGAGLDGALAGHPQRTDHLDRAVLGLGGASGLPGLDRAGSGIGIDRVALATPPASLPVGTVDLQDLLAVASQEAGQAGAVAAGKPKSRGGVSGRPQARLERGGRQSTGVSRLRVAPPAKGTGGAADVGRTGRRWSSCGRWPRARRRVRGDG
jgi:hypothetical protein